MAESYIENKDKFLWVKFYSEFANKLLSYKNDRKRLLEIVIEAHKSVNMYNTFTFDEDGKLDDICPFTIFGCFNKGLTSENRTILLKALNNIFDVKEEIPTVFDGIPVISNMATWFFGSKSNRESNDISNLWDIFEKAIEYADIPNEYNRNAFASIYDIVVHQRQVKWKLSMGLYWIRANDFLNLDRYNREFIQSDQNHCFKAIRNIFDFKNPPDSKIYLMLVDECKKVFSEQACPYKSFYDLSYNAWIKSQEKPVSSTPSEQPLSKSVAKRYWLCSPGENAMKWEEFHSQGIIGIGWDNIDDLLKYKSREEIRSKMKEVYGDSDYKNDSLALWQFSHDIQAGDIIYAKQGKYKIVGRGIVENEYVYDPERNDFKHIRKVRWTHNGYWDYPGEAAMKTLTDISAMLEVVDKLESLIVGEKFDIIEKIPEFKNPPYSDDDFISEVFLSEDNLDTLKILVKTKKNLILQGAPGVGKTFIAKRLAYAIMGEKNEDRIKTVQFHQSYCYEDFMLGFKPNETNFVLTKGPFYEFCKKAEDDIEKDHFFIIDEINRGNLGKIFGELLMLIESDKRGERIEPLYSKELFSVPKNVNIIGMMNTADRSIALIDYALRRRFAFFDLMPAFESDGFEKVIQKAENPAFVRLVNCVKDLNKEILKDETLGKGFQIGHSYLCANSPVDGNWLSSVVAYELMPLIAEYWFDDKEKVDFWSGKLQKAIYDKD